MEQGVSSYDALLSKPVALLLLCVAADFGLCLVASLLPVMLLLQMSQPQVSTHAPSHSISNTHFQPLFHTHSLIYSLTFPVSPAHSRCCARALLMPFTLSLLQALSLSHTHKHTLSPNHSQWHTLPVSRTVPLSRTHAFVHPRTHQPINYSPTHSFHFSLSYFISRALSLWCVRASVRACPSLLLSFAFSFCILSQAFSLSEC